MKAPISTALALGAIATALALGAAPATAAPVLGLELERPTRSDPTTPLTHSDERTVYLARVKNTASAKPALGDELTCIGTPADGKNWANADSFAYSWVRNGVQIGGANERTYTVAAADEGKALQCVVVGTNSNAGKVLVKTAAEVSRTTAGSNVVSDVFTAAGAGTVADGSNTISGVTADSGSFEVGQELTTADASGTATLTAGSNTLTSVASATGTGDISNANAPVKNVTATKGRFLVGQEVTGPGIQPGTTIVSASEGELTLSKPATATETIALAAGAQPFVVGQTVEGTGVPAGTTITAIAGQTMTLSANATASGSGVSISGPRFPSGTTITTVGAGSIEVSAVAEGSGKQTLFAGAQPFEVGQEIQSYGNASLANNAIPSGTTITGSSGSELTLSNNATASFTYLRLRAVAPIVASAAVASQPPLVVEPQPGTAPPAPVSPTGNNSRPVVKPQENGNYSCDTSAMSWSGSPTFARQWLRNGDPVGGETGAEYVPGPEDVGTKLQCRVVGSNAGGAATAISSDMGYDLVGVPSSGPLSTPTTTFSNTMTGAEVDFELPGGQETYALRVLGTENPKVWSCTKEPPTPLEHAGAHCERSDDLAPGAAYPDIELVERPGYDAPDLLTTKASASGGGAADTVSREDSFTVGPAVPFGIEAFDVDVLNKLGAEETQAGGHPHSVAALLAFKDHVRGEASAEAGFRAANGSVRTVRTKTPRGFLGNPGAVGATCATIADIVRIPSSCPPESIVGGITIQTSQGPFENLAIFSLQPEYGTPAQFGFAVASSGAAYALTPELRAQDGYAIDLVTAPVQKNPELFEAEVTLCGFGAKSGPNPKNGETEFQGCREATEAGAAEKPFLTNPTRCSGAPPTTRVLADSWEEPGHYAQASSTDPALTGCEAVEFEPEISFAPTTEWADSPTGLDVELEMPNPGLEDPEGIAAANLADSTVKLPVGMAVNPSLANGLGACTPAQIGLGSNEPPSCPQSSRVGTAEVHTPLLEDPLKGSVYVARQSENPFNSLLALYLVLSSKRDGITIKVAGKVSPDPTTGQLTASFTENPEAPFSRLSLHLAGGDRAALINPPACGIYTIESAFSPWSAADPANPTEAEIVRSDSQFRVTRGPGAGPCPRGEFEPRLQAGTTQPQAGAPSPFLLRLHREDGTRRFRALTVSTPAGLSAYLKGVPYCPEAAIAAISPAAGAGQGELDNPSCPAAAQIGTVAAGAGAGPDPFYVQSGKAYLAGPYKGAPISILTLAPAVAGPFDLGTVAIRNAIQIDPRTAQITVTSDPIPTILHGILLDLREIRVMIDRPGFTLNPTNCSPMRIDAGVSGTEGSFAALSNRFQVGGCAKLPFKPQMTLRLKGGTGRTAHPKLIATLFSKGAGVANLRRVQVKLPPSAFLDQAHIRTICTRVQWAAGAGNGAGCPKGSIYGRVWVKSPIVDYWLAGNVYLRSSNHKLPDLVLAINGPDSQPIAVELSGKTDSVKRALRNTFQSVPDAPFTKARVVLFGGHRGLVVNSRNLCAQSKRQRRANVRLVGQNGKREQLHPLVRSGCKKAKRKRHRGHRQRGGHKGGGRR